ncbi:MAG: 16S rRNA (cytosine(1402)-N(4))-methyltransferase RsmH [Bacteroidales bacterium]|nr:16S rRNA (cytosine(1402)-N(4))-methyltransferase RsmH [Bacteroidales bacterium]
MEYHNPVLRQLSVDYLVTNPNGTYVDVTYGGGGHSRCILEKLDQGRLIAFDQDSDAQSQLLEDERFTFVASNFKNLNRFLKYHQAFPVDGILADLGVSSHQFDTPERGFSYREDGVLDMRMNTQTGKTAQDIVNQYDEKALSDIFYRYGELSDGRTLARRILKAREEQPITTTGQLVEALKPSLIRGKENKSLSKIFQAIRIEVNQEMAVLESFLTQSLDALKEGGRLVIIAYHSLEDRLVKNFMRSGNLAGEVEKDFYGNPQTPFKLVTRKAIQPDIEEITINPRARSAKLRVAEKITPVNHGNHLP